MSVGDAVYSALLDAITRGDLEPGSKIREVELARQLGVSRTPLREAVPRLIALGLLQRLPSGSVRVAEMSAADAASLVDVREVLEGLVARIVANRVRSGDLATSALMPLKTTLDAMDPSAEARPRDLIRLGQEFHLSLAELSENEVLTRYLEQIIGSLGRYRHILWKHAPRRNLNVEVHRRILDLVMHGDAVGAEQLMKEHIRSAKAEYASLMEAAKVP